MCRVIVREYFVRRITSTGLYIGIGRVRICHVTMDDCISVCMIMDRESSHVSAGYMCALCRNGLCVLRWLVLLL